MEKQNTTWEEIRTNIWKPIVDGDMIEGVLISKKDKVGTNESNVYYIENREGIKMIWGTTVLNDRLALINIGELIRITYKGEQKNKKGQPIKIYKVEISKRI